MSNNCPSGTQVLKNRDVHGRSADGSQPHALGHLLLATQLGIWEDLDVDGAFGLRIDAVRHELHADGAREIDIAECPELAGDCLGDGRDSVERNPAAIRAAPRPKRFIVVSSTVWTNALCPYAHVR